MDDHPLPGSATGPNGDGDLLAALREVLGGTDRDDAALRHGVASDRLERWHRRAIELAVDAVGAIAASGDSAPVATRSDPQLVDHLMEENERLWDLVLGAPTA